jgi:hypothetical protein
MSSYVSQLSPGKGGRELLLMQFRPRLQKMEDEGRRMRERDRAKAKERPGILGAPGYYGPLSDKKLIN